MLPSTKTVVEATVESVLNSKFSMLVKDLEQQRERSWQIVIGVVVAFIFTLGIAVLEIVVFHTRENNDQRDFQNISIRKMEDVEARTIKLEFATQNLSDHFLKKK